MSVVVDFYPNFPVWVRFGFYLYFWVVFCIWFFPVGLLKPTSVLTLLLLFYCSSVLLFLFCLLGWLWPSQIWGLAPIGAQLHWMRPICQRARLWGRGVTHTYSNTELTQNTYSNKHTLHNIHIDHSLNPALLSFSSSLQYLILYLQSLFNNYVSRKKMYK